MTGTTAAKLVPLLEGHYLALAHSPSSSRRVGRMIIDAISTTFEQADIDNYADILDAFVIGHRTDLETLYSDYGPHSAVAYLPTYVLFGQAESLAIFERLSTKRHALAAAWSTAGMPRTYLEAVASAAGYDLPDVRGDS